jgi:hypothetical protein
MSHPSDDDFAKLERLADATNADPEGMLAGKLATFCRTIRTARA